eukprot:g17626.t1
MTSGAGAGPLASAQAGAARRRLYHEYQQLLRDGDFQTQNGIRVEMVESNAPWEWHVVFSPRTGNFTGLQNLHLVFLFSEKFPEVAPAVTLSTYIPHSNIIPTRYVYEDDEDENGHRGPTALHNYLCTDILQNFWFTSTGTGSYLSREEEESGVRGVGKTSADKMGWSPGYSVQALLIQVQAFLFDDWVLDISGRFKHTLWDRVCEEGGERRTKAEVARKLFAAQESVANFTCGKCNLLARLGSFTLEASRSFTLEVTLFQVKSCLPREVGGPYEAGRTPRDFSEASWRQQMRSCDRVIEVSPTWVPLPAPGRNAATGRHIYSSVPAERERDDPVFAAIDAQLGNRECWEKALGKDENSVAGVVSAAKSLVRKAVARSCPDYVYSRPMFIPAGAWAARADARNAALPPDESRKRAVIFIEPEELARDLEGGALGGGGCPLRPAYPVHARLRNLVRVSAPSSEPLDVPSSEPLDVAIRALPPDAHPKIIVLPGPGDATSSELPTFQRATADDLKALQTFSTKLLCGGGASHPRSHPRLLPAWERVVPRPPVLPNNDVVAPAPRRQGIAWDAEYFAARETEEQYKRRQVTEDAKRKKLQQFKELRYSGEQAPAQAADSEGREEELEDRDATADARLSCRTRNNSTEPPHSIDLPVELLLEHVFPFLSYADLRGSVAAVSPDFRTIVEEYLGVVFDKPQLTCFYTKQPPSSIPRDDPARHLGIGLQLSAGAGSMGPSTKQVECVFDLLSRGAFHDLGVRKSPLGQALDLWLPLAIDRAHFEAVLPHLKQTLARIFVEEGKSLNSTSRRFGYCNGGGVLGLKTYNGLFTIFDEATLVALGKKQQTSSSSTTPLCLPAVDTNKLHRMNYYPNRLRYVRFDPKSVPPENALDGSEVKQILTVLLKLMNSQLVQLMKNDVSGSEKALRGYLAFHHLLLLLCEKFPILRFQVECLVENFVENTWCWTMQYSSSCGGSLSGGKKGTSAGKSDASSCAINSKGVAAAGKGNKEENSTMNRKQKNSPRSGVWYLDRFRTKYHTPDLGEFFCLLSVSDSYSWQDLVWGVFEETMVRCVKWLVDEDQIKIQNGKRELDDNHRGPKKAPKNIHLPFSHLPSGLAIVSPLSPVVDFGILDFDDPRYDFHRAMVGDEVAAGVFLEANKEVVSEQLFRGTVVSRRLLMFHAWFLNNVARKPHVHGGARENNCKIICTRASCSLPVYERTKGIPSQKLVTDLQRAVKEITSNHVVDSWGKFFERISLEVEENYAAIGTRDGLLGFFRECERKSELLQYHGFAVVGEGGGKGKGKGKGRGKAKGGG